MITNNIIMYTITILSLSILIILYSKYIITIPFIIFMQPELNILKT